MSPRMPEMALPLSTASISAREPALPSTASASRRRYSARRVTGSAAHAGNAALAAATARSTSCSPASGTAPSFSPLAGLMLAIVCPERDCDPFAADEQSAWLERQVWRLHQGTIAARSTVRSAALRNASSSWSSPNLASTIRLNGNRSRLATTKSSA